MNFNERPTPICDALRSRIGGRDSMIETDMADWEDKAIQLERQCQELAEALLIVGGEPCLYECHHRSCMASRNWAKLQEGVKG